MNGRRYFLDTNAIVQLLAGNRQLLAMVAGADYVATSVICELEFLSFPELGEEDKVLFRRLVDRIDVLDVRSSDSDLIAKVIELRKRKKLKLPDALIAGTAALAASVLITADRQLLKLPDVEAIEYPMENCGMRG